jgi:hypothetical protein
MMRHISEAIPYRAVLGFAFSLLITQSRFSLQTSMFAGEHFPRSASSAVWKRAMSIRGTEVGSGLIMLAENEAFAMARE